MSGPLAGLRILDLTRLLPGAFGTGLLGDLGAEVIKVEQPVIGDYMRQEEPRIGNNSAYSWTTDRNKRSISLDLKEQRGVEVLLRLCREADVLIEGFRPGVVDRLGIGYEAVNRVNPDLVYCSLTGYGQSGPHQTRAGHDLNYLGLGGALSVIGTRERPVVPGIQLADMTGAALACVGILASVIGVLKRGGGDHVDISMTDAGHALLAIHAVALRAGGPLPGRETMWLNGAIPAYNVYYCSDGRWLTVAATERKFFVNLCEAIGRPDLIETHMDPNAVDTWRDLFADRTSGEWLEILADRDTCVGPLNDLSEAITEEQFSERGLVTEMDDADGRPQPQAGTPIGLAERPPSLRSPAPGLGEDTAEVLAEAGYSAEQIRDLFEAGVAYAEG